MQPDAAARGPSTELRDVRCAMDGEVAVVEDRVRHRSIVVEGGAMVAGQRLRPKASAWCAIDPRGDRPRIAVLPVHDHGHPLVRLVDPHKNFRARVARGRKHRNNDGKPSRTGDTAHYPALLHAPPSDTRFYARDGQYHHKVIANLNATDIRRAGSRPARHGARRVSLAGPESCA